MECWLLDDSVYNTARLCITRTVAHVVIRDCSGSWHPRNFIGSAIRPPNCRGRRVVKKKRKKENKERNGSLMSKPDVKWPLLEIEWETGSRNQNRESLGSVRETGRGGTHTYSPPPPPGQEKKTAPLQLWLFLQPGSPLNCSDAAVVLVFARILSLQTIPSAFAVLIRSQLLAGCGNRPINNENTYCPWKPLGCPVLGNEQEVERQPREDDDECVERTHGLAHDRRNGEVRWGPEHQDGNKEPNLYGRKTEWLTLSLPSAKTTFCLPSKRNVWVK